MTGAEEAAAGCRVQSGRPRAAQEEREAGMFLSRGTESTCPHLPRPPFPDL